MAACKWVVDEPSLRVAIGKAFPRRPDAGVDNTDHNVFASTGTCSGPGWTSQLIPKTAWASKTEESRRGRCVDVMELVCCYRKDVLLRRECGSLFCCQFRGKTIKANCIVMNLRSPSDLAESFVVLPLEITDVT